ncbi:serine/threonine protein kinase [Blastopirellula sp. JC732]|uniref:Serine/threonine protein kinase n=1 Tax=Blastopirellula sediminis TaxID=2894196 RepID=A0A9X1SGN6_9BACT|nr:serine/threonine-protein kinase [Blastopirellula sediminis]MCC9607535.1 serine/threonine protein kinase [Blastopirellula sediminis]MCC9629172.1 serine/threonine protein kinase [Blastopirellula sediminis]
MKLLDKLAALFKSNRLDIPSRFERIRESITGTMSEFMVVREHSTGRIYGLKILDKEKQEFFDSRFVGLKRPCEGEIACSMKHPNVAEAYEHGLLTTGQQYVLMEMVDGRGLQAMCNDHDPHLEGEQLNLLRQMSEALIYVHERGFIHRDICSRNFIVSRDGKHVKLIDFGLTLPAKPEFMTAGNRTGTPNYMSPEIVRRRPTDQRSDIFAFGVTAYRLCCYEFPWPAQTGTGKDALQHDTVPPTDITKVRPYIDPRLAAAIHACIKVNPKDRPQTMRDFLTMIAGIKEIDTR